jgi:hypothetical protein
MQADASATNSANAQIGDWLGLQPPATESEILRIVEGRLTPSVIKRLAALGLERGEIDAVVIPARTLQHRRSRRENRRWKNRTAYCVSSGFFRWRSRSMAAVSGP